MARSEEREREISIFRNVAHSTDPIQRQRAVKKIKAWLAKHEDANLLQYLKIWKPLWMAYWHSDKRAVQQSVAVDLSKLLNDVPEPLRAEWVMAFFLTMQLNWTNLDRIRMDKYLLFVRIFVAEMIAWISNRDFDEEALDELNFVLTVGGPFRGHIMKREGLPDILDSLPHRLVPSVESSLGLTCHFMSVYAEELIYTLSDPECPPGAEEDEEAQELIAVEKERLSVVRPQVLDNVLMPILECCAHSHWEPVSQPAMDAVMRLVNAFPADAPLNELASFAFAKGADKKTTIPNRARLYELVKVCEEHGGQVDAEVMQEVMREAAQSQADGAKAARMALEEQSGVKLNRRERARLAREAEANGEEAPELVDTAKVMGGRNQKDVDAATAALIAKFGGGGGDISDDEDEDQDGEDDDMDAEDMDDMDMDGDDMDGEEFDEDEMDFDEDDDEEDEEDSEEEEEEEPVVPEPPAKRLRNSRDSVTVSKEKQMKEAAAAAAAAAQAEAEAAAAAAAKAKQDKKKEKKKTTAELAAELEAAVNARKSQKKASAAADEAAVIAAEPAPVQPAISKAPEAAPAEAKKTKKSSEPTPAAPAAAAPSPAPSAAPSANRIRIAEKHATLLFDKKLPSVLCRASDKGPVDREVAAVLVKKGEVPAEQLPSLPNLKATVTPPGVYRKPKELTTEENAYPAMDAVTRAAVQQVRKITEQRQAAAMAAEKKQAAYNRLADVRNRINQLSSQRQKQYKPSAGKKRR